MSNRRSRSLLRFGVLPLAAGLLGLTSCNKYGSSLNRPEEAVVTTGARLAKLIGSSPVSVVGFAWDGGSWHQIPVQVDERDLVNPGQILHRPPAAWAKLPDGSPFKILAYTTRSIHAAGYGSWPTYTPVDSDPTVDANDEVSFLSNDAGVQAPGSAGTPASVVAATRQVVKVSDPLDPDGVGYVYLYRSDTLTGGSAGTTGVSYRFSLDSGDYRSTYRMGLASSPPNKMKGPNPEHSSVSTAAYRETFGDRWLNNGLSITAGGAPGTGTLERERFQFKPGLCGRSEDTFDNRIPTNAYEGAFIANIRGPVRAIRSYLGANSGQYTAATNIFYPQREDAIVDLRVHAIPGVMNFDDHLTGVTGLRYSDDHNTALPIDGRPDTIAPGPPTWQMVSGAPGSLVTTRSLSTDMPGVAVATYQLDQRPASPAPCTGDDTAWGQSGVQVTGAGGGSLACTDPTRYGVARSCPPTQGRSTAYSFAVTRHRFFQRPNLPTSSASVLATHARTPLRITVS